MRRWLPLLVVLACACFVVGDENSQTSAIAAEDDATQTYSPGDKVQLQWAGETVEAEVVEQKSNGWVQVKIARRGRELTPTLPSDKLKPLAGGKSKPGSTKAGPSKAGKMRDKATGDKAAAEDNSQRAPAEAEFRSWSDKSGKFKITAKFLEIKDEKVRLEQENGKIVSIALESLAPADRKAAEELANGGGEEAKKNQPRRAGVIDGSEAATIEPKEVDWAFVEAVTPSFEGAWNVKVDAAPNVKALAPEATLLPLEFKSKLAQGGISIFNRVEAVLFSRDGGLACVATTDAPERVTKPVTLLQRVDLEKGKALETVQFPGDLKALDIDPAGRRILLRTVSSLSKISPRLTVWEHGEGGIEHVATWNPVSEEDRDGSVPQFGLMVDADHVLSAGTWGNMVLWDIAAGRPLYRVQVEFDSQPALSPGRNLVAVSTEKGVFLLNAKTGEAVGKLPSTGRLSCVFEFSPSGRRLAALSVSTLYVWDLERGELYRQIPVRNGMGNGIDWVSEENVLVNGEVLVDLERRFAYWKYSIADSQSLARPYGEMGGVFWYVLTSHDRTERGIFGVTLPHDDAKKAVAAINPNDLLVLKPGTKVKLDVNVRGTPEQQQKVKDSLTGKLQEVGVEVVAESALVLAAKTEPTPPEEVTYAPFGAAGRDESNQKKVTVSGFRNWVGLLENNIQIWESFSVSGGGLPFVQIKQGESIEQALVPWQQPDLSYFDKVTIPRDIVAAKTGFLGASDLTAQGVGSERAAGAPQGPGVGQPPAGKGRLGPRRRK